MNLIALTQIVFIFILPVLLLYTGIIPVKYRFLVLVLASLVIFAITIQEHWTPAKLGIRADNFVKSIIPYLIFTILGVLVIYFFAKFLGRSPVNEWWTKSHFVYIFIPISIFQEFAFRAFLMPKLESLFLSAITLILVNALLFAFLHIIYPHPSLNLPFGFIAGVGFATMYYFYPNLILISISHSVLNFFAVFYSFFSFNKL